MSDEYTDVQLMQALARHLRKHDVGCFDDQTDEQERAERLLEQYVEWLIEQGDPR